MKRCGRAGRTLRDDGSIIGTPCTGNQRLGLRVAGIREAAATTGDRQNDVQHDGGSGSWRA